MKRRALFAVCSSAWRLSPRCSGCCRVWLCCQPLGGPGRHYSMALLILHTGAEPPGYSPVAVAGLLSRGRDRRHVDIAPHRQYSDASRCGPAVSPHRRHGCHSAIRRLVRARFLQRCAATGCCPAAGDWHDQAPILSRPRRGAAYRDSDGGAAARSRAGLIVSLREAKRPQGQARGSAQSGHSAQLDRPNSVLPHRHGGAWPRHPRLPLLAHHKTWMAGLPRP